MAQLARGVGKNAPLLVENGNKWNNVGTRSKDNPKGLLFGQMPSLLRRYIWHSLSGRDGNLIKIIELFIQQESGKFRASKEWVMKETGMAANKYYEARRKLEELGFITYDPEEEIIYINYDYLWQQAYSMER